MLSRPAPANYDISRLWTSDSLVFLSKTRNAFFQNPYLPHCSAEDLTPVGRDHEHALDGVHIRGRYREYGSGR